MSTPTHKAGQHEQSSEGAMAPATMPLGPSQFPIQLRDVLLYEAHITRDSERLDVAPGSHGLLDLAGVEPLIAGPVMNASIRFRAKVPNAEAPLYTIEVTLTGVFDIAPDTPRELVMDFGRTSVLPLLWPYAREAIENLSVRMRVPAIVLAALDLRTGLSFDLRPKTQGSSERNPTTE